MDARLLSRHGHDESVKARAFRGKFLVGMHIRPPAYAVDVEFGVVFRRRRPSRNDLSGCDAVVHADVIEQQDDCGTQSVIYAVKFAESAYVWRGF